MLFKQCQASIVFPQSSNTLYKILRVDLDLNPPPKVHHINYYTPQFIIIKNLDWVYFYVLITDIVQDKIIPTMRFWNWREIVHLKKSDQLSSDCPNNSTLIKIQATQLFMINLWNSMKLIVYWMIWIVEEIMMLLWIFKQSDRICLYIKQELEVVTVIVVRGKYHIIYPYIYYCYISCIVI